MTKVNVKSQVVVSMTTYPARIHEIGLTIYSILRGTVKPDTIVCNLAKPEFPHQYNDLPNDIKTLVRTSKLYINWVDKNTKQFKKIIPTMKLYPDAAIISIDDDLIYPQNFVETLYGDYKAYNGKYPITCGHFIDKYYYKAKPSHHGSFTLVTRDMFGDNFTSMQYLIDTHLWNEIWFDDPLYTYAIMGNGLEYKLSTFNGYKYKKQFPCEGVGNHNASKRDWEHKFLSQFYGVF